MRALHAAVLAGLFLTTALAGCITGDDGEGDDQVLKEQAQAGERTGGVQGVVTDNAVQPIEGANVTLIEIDETTQTATDGSYAFSNLDPGSYTVSVNASGFVSARNTTDVSAGEVTNVDFLLTHLQSTEAYTQVFELQGFFECGVEVGYDFRQELPEVPEPPEQVPWIDPRYFFLGLAACAAGNIGSENTTNDKFSHFFEFEPPVDTVVYEMTWEANNQFSDWMTTRMEVEGFANDGVGTVFRTQGPSPIVERLEKPTWENLSANFTEQCEQEGDDDYCGYSFWDNGWPMQTRVFPAWQCQSEDAGVCAVAQQEFTHFVSAFYNGPAPEGYSITESDGASS